MRYNTHRVWKILFATQNRSVTESLSSVKVFWVILVLYIITFKLKETCCKFYKEGIYLGWINENLREYLVLLWFLIIHQIFSLARDCSEHFTWLSVRMKFPTFQDCACCEKYLKDNKHNILHLMQKYAGIFVLGHYLFLKAHTIYAHYMWCLLRVISHVSANPSDAMWKILLKLINPLNTKGTPNKCRF